MGHTDRAALIATVKQLWIDANRLCDRQLGGTYEYDCRLSLKQAEPAIDAIAALLEAEAWQPIATAPKDGTPILRPHIIWGAMDVRYAVKPVLVTPLTADTNWEWLNGDYTTAWPDTAFHPFWRPLPAPPVTEAKP